MGTVRAEPRKNSARQGWLQSALRESHTALPRGWVSANHVNSQNCSCLLAEDKCQCFPWISPEEACRRPLASRAFSTPPEPRTDTLKANISSSTSSNIFMFAFSHPLTTSSEICSFASPFTDGVPQSFFLRPLASMNSAASPEMVALSLCLQSQAH